jgi:hypothetical protein
MQIEGYTIDGILALSDEEIEAFAFTDAPLVLRVGSSQVLCQFRLSPERLTVDLAHIDGGGEGVLLSLWVLAERLARRRGLSEVEWIVHAVNCAKPNLKLRRVLERKGFAIRDVEGVGEVFYKVSALTEDTSSA